MAKKPQPKPPPRAGGGARSAGQGTLAQATGGKPGKVQSQAPKTKSLGLGLGLGARQRGNFQAAAQGGSGGQWLANHPGVQQKIGRIDPNSAQGGMRQTRIENFMGSGQSQKPPQPPTTQRQPRGAQQMGPQAQAPLGMPPTRGYPGYDTMGGNFAQGTGDRLNQGTMGGYPTGTPGSQMGGYSGDNAGQQGQLGQQGGGMQNPPSGYGYDANGNMRQGWRPPSAGGIGGNSMMSTSTMYPAEMNQPPNPWAQQGGQQGGGGYGYGGMRGQNPYGQMQPQQGGQNIYGGQAGGGMAGQGGGRYGQQQAPNFGGGMGYHGAIGGAGWMQQPTQQQIAGGQAGGGQQGGYGGQYGRAGGGMQGMGGTSPSYFQGNPNAQQQIMGGQAGGGYSGNWNQQGGGGSM